MQQHPHLEEFSYMWDGSEDWALYQHDESRVMLRVAFANSKPNISELMALRKLLNSYANMPPNEFRAMVGNSGQFDMGSFDRSIGIHLWTRAKEMGLTVEQTWISLNVTAFLNRTTKMMPIIEDDNLSSQIAEKMIEHGRPIITVEVD